jgi:hypothetical protein
MVVDIALGIGAGKVTNPTPSHVMGAVDAPRGMWCLLEVLELRIL